ncbi:MAG: M3 family metallopeptidase [Campylobacterota bacterium]|nr:M3 family metallopeptidase [Campylobacterota bacterium]
MFNEFNTHNLEQSEEILTTMLRKSRADIDTLLDNPNKTYSNFVTPYQLIAQDIEEFITPIFHLDSVKNSELTQKVYAQILPLISIYQTELSQNEYIYSAIKDIQDNDYTSLSIIQQKVIDNEIRDFKLGGCGLSDEKKEKLKQINLSLSELSKKFSQNLLDATNAFELILDNEKDIQGIPSNDLELAAFTDESSDARRYKFTLQMPSYIAYMTYGPNRDHRQTLYKAYTTRAPQNEKIIEKILKLKNEEAHILGFDNYAALSIEPKMATSQKEVIQFLEDLASKGKERSLEELQEVKDLAKKLDNLDDIQSYDMGYYSEKLKKEQYDIDQEYYRPYFEQQSVLRGFFDFLHNLFNITLKEVSTPSWDDKVNVYDIYVNNKIHSRIYMDLEARKDKRGGAWMNNWHNKYVDKSGKQILPTAYIVCNFPASTQTTPSLLRHDDVVTLFHEMGHALHHLLTQIDEPFVGGINGVAWDAVEFPSQFLEYFAYEAQVLKTFAKHYKTKEVLDDISIEKLKRAKNFQSSTAMIRQVEFALFDFKLHQELYNAQQMQTLLDDIRQKYAPLLPPSYNKFQNGFAHIFAGGYAAGYYSYKWAEVLSAHAFYKFLDKGVFDQELSNLYKDLILGQGGSQNMDQLFFQLIGEKPQVDSLLKIDGIIS